MEPSGPRAACGSNPLILKEAAPTWQAGLGLEVHVPQKLSKNHIRSARVKFFCSLPGTQVSFHFFQESISAGHLHMQPHSNGFL